MSDIVLQSGSRYVFTFDSINGVPIMAAQALPDILLPNINLNQWKPKYNTRRIHSIVDNKTKKQKKNITKK